MLSATDTLSGCRACVLALFTTEQARSIITTFTHSFIRPSVRPARPSVSLSLSRSRLSPRARLTLSNLPTHDPKRIRKCRTGVLRRPRASGTDDDGETSGGGGPRSIGRSATDQRAAASVALLTPS